jgi:hypothetical protein
MTAMGASARRNAATLRMVKTSHLSAADYSRSPARPRPGSPRGMRRLAARRDAGQACFPSIRAAALQGWLKQGLIRSTAPRPSPSARSMAASEAVRCRRRYRPRRNSFRARRAVSKARRGHRARHRVRGRAPDRDRQAGRPGGAPGQRQCLGHDAERAAAPRAATGRHTRAPASCIASTRTPAACWWWRRRWSAQTDLVRQMQARTVKRHYLALALGTVERDGLVDAPLGRHAVQRTKMAIVAAAARRRAPTTRCWSASQGATARMPAGDRDVPTRSACTWPRSSIPGRRCGVREKPQRRCAARCLSAAGAACLAAGIDASRERRRDGLGSAAAGRLREGLLDAAWLVSSFPTGRRRPVCVHCRRRVAVASACAVAGLQSRRPCRR